MLRKNSTIDIKSYRSQVYGCLATMDWSYLVLTVITLLLLFLPLEKGMFFGSEGDWYSQHVGAAEGLRKMILDTGSLFPQYSAAGGGCNIYDFAYYGLLRPDVLFSCLVPELEMKYIIAGYAVLGVAASVSLCHFWLKKQGLTRHLAFAGSLLMAASACFFQAHHQVVFVNYMPFLILALLGIDRLITKGRSGLMIVSLFLIYMHSFYYAFTCLLVCLIYYIYQMTNHNEDGLRGFMKMTGRAAIAVIVSISMAAVLLIPTALNILSTEKDAGAFMSEPIDILDLRISGLLYIPYGCGMTLLALYCLLLSLTKKRKRFLAAAILLCLLVPAVALMCNGFLYSRAKILIPLVPIIVLVCADTLQDLYQEKQKHLILPALLCFLPAAFSPWQSLILLDEAILLVWVLLQRLRSLPAKVKLCTFTMILLLPICVNLGMNKSETFLKSDDDRQSRFSAADIGMFATDRRYRFDYLSNNYVNSNIVAKGDLLKTAMYSSINNRLYADFYYNVMRNPISLRNRVVLMPNQNSFFSYFMGIRYILTGKDNVPHGYETVFERNGHVLAENEDVLPICYGSSQLLSVDDYENLEFPDTLEALCSNVVVTGAAQKPFQTHVKEVSLPQLFDAGKDERILAQCQSARGFRPSLPEETEFRVSLSKPLQNQVLIITFDVESLDGREVIISMNGMNNNLSARSAPYPNKNNTFTYVLPAENLAELEVELTKGDYRISSLRVYTMDMAYLNHRDIDIPTESGEKDDKTMFQGDIELSQDGYFVTSFPYRKGYEILVDGKETEAEVVNTAFVGFPMTKGLHYVEIAYVAPGFKMGRAVSTLSIILLLAIIIIERKRRK